MQRPEYHIIVKILKSNATRTERDVLARWIKTSTANKVEFEKLKSIWIEYGKHHENYPVDTISDFFKLEKRTSTDINRARFIYKVAATVALFLLIGFTVFELSRPTPDEKQMTFSSTKDGKTVMLPDGSVVTLRAGARIILDHRFNENVRNLKLIGEAFFDIKSNPNKPFHVKSESLSVQVLGTSFLIKPALDRTEVALFHGEIEVFTDKERLKITPNQTAVLQSKLVKREGIDRNIRSWQTKKLSFEKERLSYVFRILENHYQVRIERSKQLEEKRLTGSFEDQSLEEILSIISNIHYLQVEKKANNHYYLIPK